MKSSPPNPNTETPTVSIPIRGRGSRGMRVPEWIGLLGNDPYFDWLAIVVAATVLALALAFWAAYAYVDIDGATGSSSAAAAAPLKPALDSANLDRAVRLIGGAPAAPAPYAGPGDPSLP